MHKHVLQNRDAYKLRTTGVRLSFLTQTDQSKFEQLFAQSAAAYGGNKIPGRYLHSLIIHGLILCTC